MNSSELDELLSDARSEAAEPLPKGFAVDVVSAAREFRRRARENWRISVAFTVAALVFSAFLGFSIARKASETAPPPLSLFQAGSGSVGLVP